ncbi:MAG: exodeoxyribonuclease VII large subunit [Chloroflexi bacterium]|nr:exodeoxyribonuclease VII large subunit [Chloroflexota bacterium]
MTESYQADLFGELSGGTSSGKTAVTVTRSKSKRKPVKKIVSEKPTLLTAEKIVDEPPHDMAPKEEAPAYGAHSKVPEVFTVGSVVRYLRAIVAGDRVLRDIKVEGEISNFRRYPSGHCYFDLKEEKDILPGVMFVRAAKGLDFKPEDGMQVVARGKIDLYPPQGKYQLIVEEMTPAGWGKLLQAFILLKEKLEKEGLFAPERKRQLPGFIKKAGVVTSAGGAAVRDIIRTAYQHNPALKLIISPSPVQGEGAPESLINALKLLWELPGLNVIIIGRGGGSFEDLNAFNDERLARAIAASPVPVISAVGHEVDFTISDFVADIRAATPTAAARLLGPSMSEMLRGLGETTDRLDSALGRRLAEWRTLIAHLNERLSVSDPGRRLKEGNQRLKELILRLQSARFLDRASQDLDMLALDLYKTMWKKLNDEKLKVKHLDEKLGALSPVSILKRGYSITRILPAGTVLTSTEGLHAGEKVEVRLFKGRFTGVIENINTEAS